MNKRRVNIILLLLLGLFFHLGCGTAEDHDDKFKVELPQPQPVDWEEIYQDNILSIPMIVVEKCYVVAAYCDDYGHGTGFVVGDSVLASNMHVAEFYFEQQTATAPADTVYYQLYAKYPATNDLEENHFLPDKYYVTGVYSLTDRDIALLQVATLNNQPVRLSADNYADLQTGDSVMIVSYPGFNEFVGSIGKIVAFFQNNGLADWLADDTNLIEYDANTYYGSSGGPVFNAEGEVSGIHFAYIPATDHPVAISIDYLKGIDFANLTFETMSPP